MRAALSERLCDRRPLLVVALYKHCTRDPTIVLAHAWMRHRIAQTRPGQGRSEVPDRVSYASTPTRSETRAPWPAVGDGPVRCRSRALGDPLPTDLREETKRCP